MTKGQNYDGQDYCILNFEMFDGHCDSVKPSRIWHEPSKSYDEDYVYTKFRLSPGKVYDCAHIDVKKIDKLIIKSGINIFGILRLMLNRLITQRSYVDTISARPYEYSRKISSAIITCDGEEYSINDLYILRDLENGYLCEKVECSGPDIYFDIVGEQFISPDLKEIIPLKEVVPYSLLEDSDFCVDMNTGSVPYQKVIRPISRRGK